MPTSAGEPSNAPLDAHSSERGAKICAADAKSHLLRRKLSDASYHRLQRRLSDGVREIFHTLGREEESACISEMELSIGLERLQLPCSNEIVSEIFQEADLNSDGLLSFTELLAYVHRREDEIAATFGRLSPHGATAEISFAELKHELRSLGITANDRQVAAFLTHLDKEETGRVSLSEFTSFVFLLPRTDVASAFEAWLANHAGGLDTGAEPGQVGVADEPVAWRASDAAVFLSGAASGVVSRTATAPLDRLKVLMQVGGVPGSPSAGVVAGLRAIYRQGGFRGFFQGNTANVIKVMPESGTKFWAYDFAKSIFCSDPRHPHVLERLLCGACAGAASCLVIYPLEVTKTRLAVAAPGLYEGVLHCMCETVRVEGLIALYKGLGASLAGIIPFSAVDLALYNTFKAELRRYRRSEPDTPTMLACGAASSCLAQLATYPLALAKTRLQACGMPGYNPGYDGLVGCVIETVRHEGVRGLYRGIVPNMLKAVPAISISYVVFENTKSLLQSHGWERQC